MAIILSRPQCVNVITLAYREGMFFFIDTDLVGIMSVHLYNWNKYQRIVMNFYCRLEIIQEIEWISWDFFSSPRGLGIGQICYTKSVFT